MVRRYDRHLRQTRANAGPAEESLGVTRTHHLAGAIENASSRAKSRDPAASPLRYRHGVLRPRFASLRMTALFMKWLITMKTSIYVLWCVCLLSTGAAFGADWQIITSPNSGNQPNTLNGIAAIAENDVWAVGASIESNSFRSRNLIEHWNGTQWSIVRSPNAGPTVNILTAVAVVSANDVWAAGYSSSNTTYSTLVEHWNGTKWSVVPSPNGFNGA